MIWCLIGLHHWEFPGGECLTCRKPDTFYDSAERAKIRMRSWRARKR